MGPSWSRLGAVLERLGGVLERLGVVLGCLGALLQAIWPDTENVEQPLVFIIFGSLGRSWRRLGASWGRHELCRSEFGSRNARN